MSLSLVVTDHHLRGDSAAVASEPAGPLPTATLGGEAKPSSHARDAGAARRALRRWSPRAWWSMDRCHVAARAAAGCGGVYAVPVVTRVAPAGRGAGSQGPDACGCGTSDARAPTSEGEKKRAAAGTESRGVDFFLPSVPFASPSKFLPDQNKQKEGCGLVGRSSDEAFRVFLGYHRDREILLFDENSAD